MGCTGPAKVPMARSAKMTAARGRCPVPSSSTPSSVSPRQARVTDLYSLLRSTKPPSRMPPMTMATSKPAPARPMVPWSSMPAPASFASMKAPTTFVTAIDVTKAARGGTKPGVWKSATACSGKEGSAAPALASWASSFSCSEAEGGVGGRSRKPMSAPAATMKAAAVMKPKYSFSPASEPPSAPPTRKAVAMPTWLKLIATAVARARSLGANQAAESRGGVHWKKGWATATSIVPATTAA
mmetsp:Transcript_67716/g.191904  ORF Transcript_67716/g.191904 Transcript_67716/m.191904 type:complete len:241 (+) Transcript_67716:441-1163(+)